MPRAGAAGCQTRWMAENQLDARRIVAVVIAVVVVVAAGFGLSSVLGGDDESTTDTSGVDDPPPDDSAPDDPAPTETPGDENTPGQVVVGQDADGDDIIVEFEVTQACAITFHTPIDDSSLSHIVWKYNAPGLDEGTQVTMILSDGTRLPATVVDKVISVEQGISSYGTYAFPEVEWEEDDATTSTITPDGEHVVDDEEGLPSETCLA